jgi:hypothetical protein
MNKPINIKLLGEHCLTYWGRMTVGRAHARIALTPRFDEF